MTFWKKSGDSAQRGDMHNPDKCVLDRRPDFFELFVIFCGYLIRAMKISYQMF
jgi:hypothetical protein